MPFNFVTAIAVLVSCLLLAYLAISLLFPEKF